jgi:hypothetical protein
VKNFPSRNFEFMQSQCYLPCSAWLREPAALHQRGVLLIASINDSNKQAHACGCFIDVPVSCGCLHDVTDCTTVPVRETPPGQESGKSRSLCKKPCCDVDVLPDKCRECIYVTSRLKLQFDCCILLERIRKLASCNHPNTD